MMKMDKWNKVHMGEECFMEIAYQYQVQNKKQNSLLGMKTQQKEKQIMILEEMKI